MANIGFRILPLPPHPPARILRALSGVAAAHLSDSMNRIFSATGLQPWHRGGHMAGVALTVRVPPGDNLMVHKALDIARPGDVIVVDAGGDVTAAIIGEIMSFQAAKRGAAGMVIDGAIRDAGVLARSRFPVYARAATHRGPYKNGPGEINVPVAIGGMVINPGDLVVGDEDGIVAFSQADAARLIEAARAKAKAEAAQLKSIARGTLDRRWVDRALRAGGCEF